MMMPVRRCQTATRFIQTPEGFYVPTNPSDPRGVDMNMFTMDPKLLKAPDITIDDFMNAVSKIRPSVAQEDLEKQIEFTSNFGQDG